MDVDMDGEYGSREVTYTLNFSDSFSDAFSSDPSVKRKGRGFNIRGGAAEVEADGVRSKKFDRLHVDEEESTRAVRCKWENAGIQRPPRRPLTAPLPTSQQSKDGSFS